MKFFQKKFLTTLPIAILMPHSACNCRCVMCDIWKDNTNKRELDIDRIGKIVDDLKKLRTRLVVLSGGEALLHDKIFDFCAIIRDAGIKISLLSTGLLLEKFSSPIIAHTNDIIVSLDGSEAVHNLIRRIPDAFLKLKTGVQSIKRIQPHFRITGRCVVQKNNFRDMTNIVRAAKDIGLDQISFLAADTYTTAFNRKELESNGSNIIISKSELTEFKKILEKLSDDFKKEFENKYIAESPQKLMGIYNHYAAVNGLEDFKSPHCNAPWVSAVIEADGSVRPCFFHEAYGSISSASLESILNSDTAVQFRKTLSVKNNPVCKRCVCSLNLKRNLF